MSSSGPGGPLWNQAKKVRVTRGKLELPVTAGKDGIQVGDYQLPKPEPRDPHEERPRKGLLARLLRRG